MSRSPDGINVVVAPGRKPHIYLKELIDYLMQVPGNETHRRTMVAELWTEKARKARLPQEFIDGVVQAALGWTDGMR